MHPGYDSNRVPSLYKYKGTTVASTCLANCSICEFKTWRRLNWNLRLSLDYRATSEDPGFATTASVTTTSLVNRYDLNASLCTSICSRNNNPTLQVNDKIWRFLPPSLAAWLCSGGLQIDPITLQCNCQSSRGLVLLSWSAIDMRSCDNMTNACLHIVALLRCILAGPGPGVRLCRWRFPSLSARKWWESISNSVTTLSVLIHQSLASMTSFWGRTIGSNLRK